MLRRNLQLILVGILVLILAASLLYSLTKLRSLGEVATREIKISMWVASQPLVELLKLGAAPRTEPIRLRKCRSVSRP